MEELWPGVMDMVGKPAIDDVYTGNIITAGAR
jgi:hypothetical protein